MAPPSSFPDNSVDWQNAPSPDDSDALERWLLTRMAHLSAEQGSDPAAYQYPRAPADAERHWTCILTSKDPDAKYKDDARAIDLGMFFDVPNGFRLDRRSAPGLVAQDPGAAVNLLRAMHHARLPCGRYMALWATTDALTEACCSLAPGFWKAVTAVGITDFWLEAVREDTFFGEFLSWVISIIRQISCALEYCATQRQLDMIGRRGDDLGMSAALNHIISVTCGNALKNQETFQRITAPDGTVVIDEQGLRLTKLLREKMGDLLVLYHSIYTPTNIHDVDYWAAIMRSPDYVDIQRMVIRSWYMNEDNTPPLVAGLLACASLYIQSSGMDAHELRDYGHAEIYAVYGLSFLERLSSCLCHPSVLEDPLRQILVFIARVVNIPDYRPHLLSSGTIKALLGSVNRQAVNGRDDDNLQSLCLSEALDVCLSVILETQSASECVTLLIELDILGHLARLVPLSIRCSLPDPAASLIKSLTEHLPRLLAQADEGEHVDKLLRNMRRVWYPIIRVATPLLAAGAVQSPLIDDWRSLGETAGLQEEEEMNHPVQLCTWRRCQYYTVRPPTPARKCQGCGEACYCSRECQKRDWRDGGHRARCRRLRGGAA
ncbi:unnamed protein product [Peniophora sp. CBMAI 1063]|nr:unnamed protein product [Peniophora sp. CBMAI 1063]